ncbi:MAG: glutathione S-transferase [Pseudomonadota bacterium]
MIVVHHLEQSRSQRILWLLEELGLDYTVEHYSRDPETNLAPASLRAVHPLGKAPVIVDTGTSPATTVSETGTIVEYLIDRYGQGQLKPADDGPAALRYRHWLHYAEGSLMLPLLLKLVMTRIATAPMPFFAKPIAKSLAAKVNESFVDPNIKLHFDYVEAELAHGDFFAGNELTGADIMMSFPLEAAAMRSGAADTRPRLKAYLQKIHARPAYQAALAKGGPYEYAHLTQNAA